MAENNQLTDIEAQLRDMGAAADALNDANEDSSSSTVRNDTPMPAATEQGQPSGGAATPDGSGTEAGDAAAESEADAETATTPPNESPYEQAKREKREREARAWQKIEEEKARVRKERDDLESERRRVLEEAEKARSQETPGPLRDDRGYSAEDYEAAAKQFQADGDDALAEAAVRQAGALRQAHGLKAQQAFARELQAGIGAALDQRPEFKDPQSEQGKAVIAVLNEFPVLRQVPGGFATAIGLLDARKSAASVPELQVKLNALTKENERLTKLTSLPGSNPSSAPREKSFDQLTPQQQERRLRRLAAEADEGA